MSGKTILIPCIPSVGKANPASSSKISSLISKTQVFLPISCKPPNGMILSVGSLEFLAIVGAVDDLMIGRI